MLIKYFDSDISVSKIANFLRGKNMLNSLLPTDSVNNNRFPYLTELK